MDTLQAISQRRSIRKFKPDPVSRELTAQILQAGIEAPSAKNRQPWRFVVVTEKEREGMLGAMQSGLDWLQANSAEDDPVRQFLPGSRYTLEIMRQAPVTIFVLNAEGISPDKPLTPYAERFMELANVQSIGAAIENMCLAATSLGLGSLWIADIYQAYPPLAEWLDTRDQLVAALSIGYPDESPPARPRKTISEITTWR